MAVKVRVGGLWKNITDARVFSGGAWRHLVAVRVRSGSTWRLITFPSSGADMSLSISPSPFALDGSGNLTATPMSGIAPYTYVWSVVSGDLDLIHTDSATVTAQAKHGHGTGTLRCVATDTLGNTATADVSGTF